MSSRAGVRILVLSACLAALATVPVRAGVTHGIVAGHRDGPVPILEGGSNIVSLDVPAGDWVVVAKATIEFAADVTVTCLLTFGSDEDNVVVSSPTDARQIALAVVHSGPPGDAVLYCARTPNVLASMRFVKITAIEVGTLSNQALPGGVPVVTGPGGPPVAKAGYRDEGVAIPAGTTRTVGTLPLPAGRWWVFGKLLAANGADVSSKVSCTLELGDPSGGYGTALALDQLSPGDISVLPLQNARRLASPGRARVRCSASAATSTDYLRIVAIRAGTLVRGTLGGTFSTSGSASPRVHAGSKAGPVAVPVSESDTSIGDLRLPAGAWVAVATATIRNTANNTGYLICTLTAGAAIDYAVRLDLTAGAPYGRTPLVLSLAHEFGEGGGRVRLRCRSEVAPLKLVDVRIVAMRAASLTNVPLSANVD